jgi:hypothetical protein
MVECKDMRANLKSLLRPLNDKAILNADTDVSQW